VQSALSVLLSLSPNLPLSSSVSCSTKIIHH
jgi:hypothetical protein